MSSGHVFRNDKYISFIYKCIIPEDTTADTMVDTTLF